VVGVAALIGCNHSPLARKENGLPPGGPPAARPDEASLVRYLNENAARVQGVQSTNVAIDCKQGKQPIGLDGKLVCQKPRNFRLKAVVVGNPAVDIGSNGDEFWYWISKANPPYVYHCSYKELGTGKVNIPFPFQPDMVVAALGMAEYDPKAKYELREQPKYLELIQDVTLPSGQAAKRMTVFNRNKVDAPQPQVIAHVLTDTKGKLICKATVHQTKLDRESGAILPTKVTLEWPAQDAKMTLSMPDVKGVKLDATRTAQLFQRSDLVRYDSYDLAKQVVDTGGGLRRASAPAIRGAAPGK
jgi:hypothetical protein